VDEAVRAEKKSREWGKKGEELKLINIVLPYTMPWRNINDLTK